MRLVLAVIVLIASSIEAKKPIRYETGMEIPLYIDTISPFSNPSETYEYYSLPFCKPDEKSLEKKKMSLGERLDGHRIYNSLYEIHFGVDVANKKICEVTLDMGQIKQFIYAIEKRYYFEMELDGLPLKGLVGNLAQVALDSRGDPIYHHFLYTHFHFTFLYNNDQVIFGNVTADGGLALELDGKSSIKTPFSYSVEWHSTEIPYKDRYKLFNDFLLREELEIHWLSIINSLCLVALLVGFIAVIMLRILKSDYARYRNDEDPEAEEEDYGWKLVHGDVFRFPSDKNLFCAFFGVGIQLLVIAVLVAILTLIGFLYPAQKGSLSSAIILLYAFTCAVSGTVSARMYKQMEGEVWTWNIILTAAIFAFPVAAVTVVSSIIANHYNTTSALPIGTMLQVLGIWLFVGFPTTILGGIAGRRTTGSFEAPVRTKNFPREIPHIPWYRDAPVQLFMAGFLPFASIYVELNYIFTSVWGRGSYQLYGILFLVFLILLIVTACITIALIYFQLSMEDHRWWWRSFFCGGSTAFFIFAYSVRFYYYRSEMSGLLQTVKYFSYVSIACYFFFCMLGAVGFYSSLIFIRRIYSNLKCD